MSKNSWPYTNPVDPAIYKDRSHWPKISIVTPSYNQGQYIEETILSILNQNYPNLEYIIIDGGSTDNTIDIIKKYGDRITYWVSEPDSGQAHAINKGLDKCTGEIFNWINSDDYLEQSALKIMADNFDLSKFSLYAAAVVNFDLIKGDFKKIENIGLEFSNFSNSIPKSNFEWHQPGVWFDLSQLREVIPLNINLNYCFDFYLMLTYLGKKKREIKYNNENVIVFFRLHGESKTVSQQQKFYKEYLLSRYFYYLHIDNNLFKSYYASLKLKKLDWQLKIDENIIKQDRIRFLIFIILNMIVSPNYKVTRYAFGALRKKWFQL